MTFFQHKARQKASAYFIGTLLLTLGFTTGCSSDSSGSSVRGEYSPKPARTAHTVGPVSTDDGADQSAPQFTADLDLATVTTLAQSDDSISSGEQFALTAMQFLIDSKRTDDPADYLDQIISDEDLREFLAQEKEKIQASEIQQYFLIDESGWVRTQLLDRGEDRLRSEFLLRWRFEYPGYEDSAYWAVVRVEVQRTSERWMVSDFMIASGPEEEVMSPSEKKIYMSDPSSWRKIAVSNAGE